MKMMYGNVPVKSMNIHHFEMDTNDCDMVASDLQAGKTAVAKGKKITGTGKSFEFASYGEFNSNETLYVPSNINVIQITSILHPTKMTVKVADTKALDFGSEQSIGSVIVNNVEHPIIVVVSGNFLSIKCDESTKIQIFYGKDNYAI